MRKWLAAARQRGPGRRRELVQVSAAPPNGAYYAEDANMAAYILIRQANVAALAGGQVAVVQLADVARRTPVASNARPDAHDERHRRNGAVGEPCCFMARAPRSPISGIHQVRGRLRHPPGTPAIKTARYIMARLLRRWIDSADVPGICRHV
jgi:hypothetical protein